MLQIPLNMETAAGLGKMTRMANSLGQISKVNEERILFVQTSLTWGEKLFRSARVAIRVCRWTFVSWGWFCHLPIRICVYCESWMRGNELRMPEYYSCISLELFMLNCFRLLPPVPPPARSSPAHRSAVWYCWSMRALASLRRCCMLALWASNPSCLNIVGTYRMSRSHLFSAPSTLAKPNPLTMKSQAEGKKKYLLPWKQCFLLLGSKWEDSLLARDWDVCVY